MRPWLEIVRKDRPKLTPMTPAGEQRGARRRSVTGRASLAPAVLAAALALTAGGPARGADDEVDPLAGLLAQNTPVICQDQTYALCAGASCFVFNDVAYCTCDVKKGNSISSPFRYDGGYVCSVNAEGANNGYMVSTFSLPPSLVAPSGTQCPSLNVPGTGVGWPSKACFQQVVETELDGQPHVDPDHPRAA